MPKYKILFNQDECMGCGTCCSVCPKNWGFDEEKGKAVPKSLEMDELGCNQDAADSCPTEAIKIQETSE